MLAIHGHKVIIEKCNSKASFSKSHNKKTLKEKCYACDVMFHHYILLNENTNNAIFNGVPHFYDQLSNIFHNSSGLYLGGRAPPLAFSQI
jgi:hypothetical protein